MKKITFILSIFTLFAISIYSQTATDLLISEYIEGSSNNKAIEIFNGTGAAVDLGQYRMYRANNGAPEPQDTLELSGTLADGDVYVIANPSAAQAILDVADLTDEITFFNGDDWLGLAKNNGGTWDVIDVIGVLGEDPGSAWNVAGVTNATGEHTLIRKPTVSSPNTDWSTSAGTNADDSEWIVQPQNYLDDLGMHTFGSSGPTATDLFISEYLEGSSNNKALEIFNGTGAPVDLSNYRFYRANNGSAIPNDTLELSGSLADGDVFVIANPSAVQAILDVSDITDEITFFNGDDWLGLAKNNGGVWDVIDVIGVLGEDPGTGWDVAGTTTATLNHTLIRKPGVTSPNTDWAASAGTNANDSEWMVEPQDYLTDLGMHTFGAPNTPPSVSNVVSNPTVPLAGENTTVTADVNDDGTIAEVSLIYSVNGGAQTSVNMTSAGAVEAIYSADIPSSAYGDGDVVEFFVRATDDLGEISESSMQGFFAGNTDIADVKVVDGDGVLVYDGYYARLTGVATVESGLYQTTNLDVNIQDATGGINLFAFGFTNTIVRGNIYSAVGILDQYNGKNEIIPDQESDITDLGPGTLPQPVIRTITEFLADPEFYEGLLVGVALVTNTGTGDPWPAAGQNSNLIITDDGGATTIIMRIDKDTPLAGTPEPTWPKDVIGIFNQFDSSIPLDEGYQIIPRDLDDIGDNIVPVELVSFSANVNDGTVKLTWRTATENNNLGFEIQRSGDDKSWQKIGFVEGTNTSNIQTYEFEDKPTSLNGAIYYRLKQIDVDGTFSFSPEVEVNLAVPLKYDLAQNFPNPFNPSTTIKFSVPEQTNIKLTVFNAIGEQVAIILNEVMEAGSYNINFDASGFNSGVYFYRIEANNFTQVKKMMLLK